MSSLDTMFNPYGGQGDWHQQDDWYGGLSYVRGLGCLSVAVPSTKEPEKITKSVRWVEDGYGKWTNVNAE